MRVSKSLYTVVATVTEVHSVYYRLGSSLKLYNIVTVYGEYSMSFHIPSSYINLNSHSVCDLVGFNWNMFLDNTVGWLFIVKKLFLRTQIAIRTHYTQYYAYTMTQSLNA